MSKKLIIFLLIAFTSSAAVFSQDISRSSKKVRGISVEGFESDAEYSKYWLNIYLPKFFKPKGKVRKRNGYLSVVLNSSNDDSHSLFVKTSDSDSSQVWMGEEGSTGDSTLVEDLLRGFISFYAEQESQRELTETEKSAGYISKQYEKLKKEENSLKATVNRNEATIQRLQERLLKLCVEQVDLAEKLDKNKSAQDSVYQDLEKVKKLVEVKKGKLKK